MRKDLKDIETQKTFLVNGMSDVPVDSKEYEQMLKQYKTLVETEEMIRKGKKERSPFEIVYKILTLGVSILGVVFVPLSLGKLAYDNDQDMSMKNGTIWNLVGKKFWNGDK